jgi:hypothetical protein
MVEPEADRARVERRDEPRIVPELVAIALAFAVEERVDIGAFVPPRLEVDDPADSVGDERAVDDDMRNAVVVDPGERPFAARVLVLRCEQPAPARVGDDRIESRDDVRRRARELALVDPLAASSTRILGAAAATRASFHAPSPSRATCAKRRCATTPTSRAVSRAQSNGSASRGASGGATTGTPGAGSGTLHAAGNRTSGGGDAAMVAVPGAADPGGAARLPTASHIRSSGEPFGGQGQASVPSSATSTPSVAVRCNRDFARVQPTYSRRPISARSSAAARSERYA